MIGRGSRPARVVAVVTAATLAASTAGCSFLFVDPPPPLEDRPPIIHCTSSDILPVVDMLITAAQVMRTALALWASDAEYKTSAIPREADVGIGIGLSALFLSSSVVGFRETSKCREMRATPEEPDGRPRVRGSRPRLTVGAPPLPRRQEEDAEERAVRVRAAEMARAERARAERADAGSPAEPDAGPTVPVPPRPAARQRTDAE